MCSSIIFLDEKDEYVDDVDCIGALLKKGFVVLGYEFANDNDVPFNPHEHLESCTCLVNVSLTARINGWLADRSDQIDWRFRQNVPLHRLTPFEIMENGEGFFNPSQFSNRTTIIDGVERKLARGTGPTSVSIFGDEFYFNEKWELVARITHDGIVDKVHAIRFQAVTEES